MGWDDKNWTPQNYKKLDEEPRQEAEPTPAPVSADSSPGSNQSGAEIVSEESEAGGGEDGTTAGAHPAVAEEPAPEEHHDELSTLLNRYVWWFLAFSIPMVLGGLAASNIYYTNSLHQSATSAYQLSQPALFNFALVTFVFKGLAAGLIGLAVALGLTKWTRDKMMQLAAVAGAFGLAGVLFLSPPAHQLYWPSTLGEVGHIEPSTESTDEIVVIFGYVINGELYKNPNYTERALKSAYPEKRQVRVYYDPRNVRYGRIEKIWSAFDYVLLVPTLLLLGLSGGLIIARLAHPDQRSAPAVSEESVKQKWGNQ